MPDSGNGFIDGKPMVWDQKGDYLHIFPGGLPRARHEQIPHDHIIVNQDGGVEYMREGGQLINDYGRNA